MSEQRKHDVQPNVVQLDPVRLVVARARLDGTDPVAALLAAGIITDEDCAIRPLKAKNAATVDP